MITKIKSIFQWVGLAISAYTMVVTLIEIDWDGETGEVKKQKAIEWIRQAGDELVKQGKIPKWVYDYFFDGLLVEWAINVLVRLAKRLGFFEKEGKE